MVKCKITLDISKVWNNAGYFKCSYNFSSDGVFKTFSDCKYVFINENALDKEGAFVQTNIINNKGDKSLSIKISYEDYLDINIIITSQGVVKVIRGFADITFTENSNKIEVNGQFNLPNDKMMKYTCNSLQDVIKVKFLKYSGAVEEILFETDVLSYELLNKLYIDKMIELERKNVQNKPVLLNALEECIINNKFERKLVDKML